MAAAQPFGSFVGCGFNRIGIARLQETPSQCALKLCQAVFRMLRLFALLGPALRPPASQCAPGLRPGAHWDAGNPAHAGCGWLRFLWLTCLIQSARVERQGTAAHFWVCFRLRQAEFWTQFTARLSRSFNKVNIIKTVFIQKLNVENGRTDYRSRPTPLGIIWSQS